MFKLPSDDFYPFPGFNQHFIFIAFHIGSVNQCKQFKGFFLYAFTNRVFIIFAKILCKLKNSQ